MNISVTEHLAGYVRKKVKSGRYNNVSEVVREALRRMEDDEQRQARLANPSAEDVLADLSTQQVESIRRRVRASMESVANGEYQDYEGGNALRDLGEEVKSAGRRALAQSHLREK